MTTAQRIEVEPTGTAGSQHTFPRSNVPPGVALSDTPDVPMWGAADLTQFEGHFFVSSRSALDTNSVFKAAFDRLAAHWRDETGMYSLSVQKVTDLSYLGIIAMGPRVIPLILEELRQKGGHWFLALEVLAEGSPVPPTDVGNINRMKSAWIQWGIQKGIIE